MIGTIFNIQHYAIHDGPGIRTTVFFKGCPLRCWWCHNPESHEIEPETIGLPDKSIEMIGSVMTVLEVMREIEKDVLFFDESGGGVTFSGGEPLMQPAFLHALLTACKQRDIHTAIDTSGYAPQEIFEQIRDVVDLFLYDLKLMDDAQHRHYTGVSNQIIIENLRMLAAQRKSVYLRVPIIPDITDTDQNLDAILDFLTEIRGCIRQVNLLPYHRIAEGKYQRYGRKNKMVGVSSPSEKRIQRTKDRFETQGVRVKIGG